jgi:hypothetical protein
MSDSTLPQVSLEPKETPPYAVGDQVEVRLVPELEGASSLRISEKEAHPVDTGFVVVEGFRISILKSGSLAVPPLEILDSEGKVIGQTFPWALEVTSVLSQGEKPPEPAPARGWDLGPVPSWAVLGLGFLSFVLFLLLFWGLRKVFRKWKKSKPEVVLQYPADPEHLEVEKALAALLREGWFESNPEPEAWKPYYFRVSEVLRRYLGRRYDQDALEATRDELLMSLSPLVDRGLLTEEQYQELEEMTLEMDLAKFSDAGSDSAETRKVRARALHDKLSQWVQKTKRKGVVETS